MSEVENKYLTFQKYYSTVPLIKTLKTYNYEYLTIKY